jgi:curved DNA-binding protein CbpA
VQIPLDHYRILGVPNDATLDQLQQAFEDRLQQLPRQQYSSAAIAARKQLLEESFVVLADPERRILYDQSLEHESEHSDPAEQEETVKKHSLNLSSKQLPGALLLLQEIGDYQTILEVGRDYFSQPINLAQMPVVTAAYEEDVVLSMALAYLEVGREEWQQSQFENAAEALQAGLAILEQEQRFPDVQSEIHEDLCKLRPYRILEALSTSSKKPEIRQKGLNLLEEMLKERGGLDGNKDDRSGLNVQDFLRYIQQLREHLTTEEQQALFEREAAQSSAVASYLAVYTLIARGVSQGQPRLIQGAQRLLSQLSDRQDIAIEQGMCWLLLGQPIAAHQSVLRTKDQDSLAFLRQYSEGAPDLVPGLYLYTENWLQQEVYPYFQELRHKRVSLKNYFNNPEIQKALSEVELGGKGASVKTKGSKTDEAVAALSTSAVNQSVSSSQFVNAAKAAKKEETTGVPLNREIHQAPAARSITRLDPDLESLTWSSEDPVLNAFLAQHRKPESPITGTVQTPSPSAGQAKQRLIGQMGVEPTHSEQPSPTPIVTASTPLPPQWEPPLPTAIASSPVQQPAQRGTASGTQSGSKKRPTARKPRKWVSILLPVLLGAGVVAGALALGRMLQKADDVSPSPIATSAVSPPATTSSPTAAPTSPIATGSTGSSTGSSKVASTAPPQPSPGANAASGTLTKADAQTIIQNWQAIKAEAKGSGYNSSKLKEVLAGSVLAEWETSIAQDKASQVYSKYTLNRLDVASVKPNGKNQAMVEATVQEKREDFAKNKLFSQKSDTYRVLYRLERQGQEWFIKGMQVL